MLFDSGPNFALSMRMNKSIFCLATILVSLLSTNFVHAQPLADNAKLLTTMGTLGIQPKVVYGGQVMHSQFPGQRYACLRIVFFKDGDQVKYFSKVYNKATADQPNAAADCSTLNAGTTVDLPPCFNKVNSAERTNINIDAKAIEAGSQALTAQTGKSGLRTINDSHAIESCGIVITNGAPTGLNLNDVDIAAVRSITNPQGKVLAISLQFLVAADASGFRPNLIYMIDGNKVLSAP